MDPASWNSLINSLPNPHVLQTWEWGQVKSLYAWTPIFVTWGTGQEGYSVHVGRELDGVHSIWSNLQRKGRSIPQSGDGGPGGQRQAESVIAAALLLQRALPVRGLSSLLRVTYVPKGPLLDWANTALRQRVLEDLHDLAHQQGSIFIKIDPDVVLGTGVPGEPQACQDPAGGAVVADLEARGWIFSAEQVQFRNTVLVDLTPAEDQLLASMKQKTRYNIRLAERKGVTIRPGGLEDLSLLYRMYAETSLRDGFVIRDENYYRIVWTTFIQAGMAEPLIAEVSGEPVAAIVVFRFGGQAWYLHGMSRLAHREKMPNYLLQWEAMRRAKAAGCRGYDLWGAPNTFSEGDPLWGVYRFKEGLGGTVTRTLGAWDLPVNPLFYRLYTQTLPRILNMLRRRGKARVRRMVG